MINSFTNTSTEDIKKKNNSLSSATAKIKSVRSLMSKYKIGAYLIPRADCFQGEFISENDNRLRWITNFSGSAGLCIVTLKTIALFVDGRYTIQAENEKNSSKIIVYKLNKTIIANWLKKNVISYDKIGFDPWLHTWNEIQNLKSEFRGKYKFKKVKNIIDKIWIDKPKEEYHKIFKLSDKYTGHSYTAKLAQINKLKNNIKVDYIIYTLPESICWLANIRGFDIPNTPIAQSYAIQEKNGDLDIFIKKEKLSKDLVENFGPKVKFFDISFFSKKLKKLKGKIWLDGNNCPIAIKSLISSKRNKIFNELDPALSIKSIKNKIEIRNSRIAHKKDGLAMINLLYWIEQNKRSRISEIDIIEKLAEFRKKNTNYFGPSFDTICGSGPNGAIIHYRANSKTNRIIKSGDLVLIDSGGQYLEGTTDITRTIGFGKVNYLKRKQYTLVLKGMIAVSKLKWPLGLTGKDLDSIPRYHLWQENLDYEHGTGHGVGSFLSVHEGPQGISKRNEVELKSGMIVSNEPGYYLQNSHGIRIENLLLIKEPTEQSQIEKIKTLSFETLTYCPFDRFLIIKDLLTIQEIEWINSYHQKVIKKYEARLDGEKRSWLNKICSKL